MKRISKLSSEQKDRIISFLSGYIEGLFNNERANKTMDHALAMVESEEK